MNNQDQDRLFTKLDIALANVHEVATHIKLLNRGLTLSDPIEVAQEAIALYQGVRHFEAQVAEVAEELKKCCSAMIEAQMIKTKQMKLQTDFGSAWIQASSVRVNYPKAKLEQLAEWDADFAKHLESIKTETHVPGSLRIR